MARPSLAACSSVLSPGQVRGVQVADGLAEDPRFGKLQSASAAGFIRRTRIVGIETEDTAADVVDDVLLQHQRTGATDLVHGA
jgi:hypothetical protein